ncbi:MAG TPA: lipid-binding SYLF domain-containing protein [Terriglobales bacterium]|nr:lipid-binding SYLF domain-containing protein [Terriglobales bacterium]
MKRILTVLLLFLLTGAALAADNREKVIGRLDAAATIMDEIMAAPDKGIPEEVLGSADCVAIVPSFLKGGFVVGGAYGKGVATCRTPQGWSAPAFFRMEGGSFGLQIGGEAADLVMLIMNEKGMQHLMSSKFQLGVDAAAVAGPVGRHAEGDTDWKLRAEVLTYSRSRGLFAGISLKGNTLRQDKDDTRAFYGRMVPFRTSLTGKIAPPAEAHTFLAAVSKYAIRASGEKPAQPAPKPEPAAQPAPQPQATKQ